MNDQHGSPLALYEPACDAIPFLTPADRNMVFTIDLAVHALRPFRMKDILQGCPEIP
jgi:hypothetical protein